MQYFINFIRENNHLFFIFFCGIRELRAASGDWINDFARRPSRRDSYSTEYLPTSEIIRNSIRRSWTISSKHIFIYHSIYYHQNTTFTFLFHNLYTDSEQQQDYLHPNRTNRAYATAPISHSESNEYTYSPVRNQMYINHNMDYQNNYDRPTPQRRVLRQSTLPTNLPHPEQYYLNNANLMAVSPNQQISPQYSPYNTDSEDMIDNSNPDLHQTRYPIRRQSTLPSRPSDHHLHQQQPTSQYISTSPNRNYSRSPEKVETEHRYPPPFVRQSTFPSNASSEQFSMHRPKILPTSPNRMNYNKSPEHCSEPDFQKRHVMLRQSTLPNPDQHIKLLPTSPPKRQLSPQYLKRSPEMLRQNTLPNPDGMNSLGPPTTKFLPISPRQKQNFLFPQPVQNPRQFLSQQNVPTVADDTYSSTGSVSSIQREQHVKMMKVRSHSNEEYGASRVPHPPEGRRLLPEIPRNRSPR